MIKWRQDKTARQQRQNTVKTESGVPIILPYISKFVHKHIGLCIISNDATHYKTQVLKAGENNDYHRVNPYYNLRNCKVSVASISLLIKPATVTKRAISLTIKLITSHTNKAHMSRNESISISGYQKDDSRLC